LFYFRHQSFENFNENTVHMPGYSSSSKSYQRATSTTTNHPYIHDPRQDNRYLNSSLNRTQSYPSFFMHPDQSIHSFLPFNLSSVIGNGNQSMNVRVREYDLTFNGSTISLPAQFSQPYIPNNHHQMMLPHSAHVPNYKEVFKKPFLIDAGTKKVHIDKKVNKSAVS
jgi:hypothetical protein